MARRAVSATLMWDTPTSVGDPSMVGFVVFLSSIGAVVAALAAFGALALAFGVDSRDAWRRR